MSYTLFLYFTGFFVGIGLLLGIVLLIIARYHRIALHSLLPLSSRKHQALLRPVSLLPPAQD